MIDGAVSVEAQVSLLSADSGGLREPLQSGTRSLLLNFAPLGGQEGPMQIGAVIERLEGSILEPGVVDATVRLRFWADEAGVYATPGTTFELWHGRVVGSGRVTRIVDEVTDDAS